MPTETLLNALPILAQFLGHKLGVRVVIGGDQARTDGQTIYLPALPDDDTARLLAHGYLDHEGAHLRYTDFRAPLPTTPLVRTLANLLEDVRIERLLGQALPGSRHNLRRLIEHLVGIGQWTAPPATATPAQQVQAYLLYRLRATVLGQTVLEPLAVEAETQLRQTLPEVMLSQLTTLALSIRQASSTQAVVTLAERIAALFTDEAPPTIRPTTAVTADTADVSAADAPTNPTTDTLRQLVQVTEAELAAGVSDLGAWLATALTQHAGRQQAQRRLVMADCEPPSPGHPDPDLCQRVRAATNALHRQLAAQVQASREEQTRRSRCGRQLQARSLYRLHLNDGAVFQHRTRQEAPNTAITLLLDRSGSMHGTMHLATEAALAIALGLAAIPGCAVRVLAFPGATDRTVLPLVNFDEHPQRVACRFRCGAGGGTPLAQALWRVGYELLIRPEPRRLLLVITDGEPNSYPDAWQVIQRCRHSGIEVLGLGIGHQVSVAGLFGKADAVSIAHSGHLAPALFRLFARRLSTPDRYDVR